MSKKSKVPGDLGLDRVRDLLMQAVAAMDKDERRSLELGLKFVKVLDAVSSGEREIPQHSPELEDFLGSEGATLAKMLLLFRRLLQPTSLIPRVLAYGREKRNKTWQLLHLRAADPVHVHGNAQALQSLMAEMQRQEGVELVVWLLPAAVGNNAVFVAYVMQVGQAPRILALHQDKWLETPFTEQEREEVLGLLVQVSPTAARRCKEFLSTLAHSLWASSREAMQPAFQALGLTEPPTDEQWTNFVPAAFLNSEVLRHWQLHVREAGSLPVAEAHCLLHGMTQSLEQVLESLHVKHKELEKAHERKTRRLRSDLERQVMMYKGLSNRLRRLEEENRQLRNQLANSFSGTQVVERPGPCLGQALDALF